MLEGGDDEFRTHVIGQSPADDFVGKKGVAARKSLILIDRDGAGGKDRWMARRARVEFEGAVYHVLDRGDRREPIFKDDADRRRFLETLGEVCQRTGWRIHAYVLMTNHYHFLLETPQANLVAGMCGKGAVRAYVQ